LSPKKQGPAEEGHRRYREVILNGKAGSGTNSHLGEAGFTRLWWIWGAIFATLTAVGIDKITKGLLQWVLMVRFFFTQIVSFGFCFFLTEWNYHGNNIPSVYMSKKTCCLKKLHKPPSLSIKGHV
jgi:hypothetical protein